jgi:hypothetical protein
MRILGCAIPVFAVSLLFSAPNHAADAARGRLTHDKRCLYCHNESIYRRDPRLVNSCDQLSKQVDIWQSNLGLNWREVDIEDVTLYLNDTFYRFECPARHC